MRREVKAIRLSPRLRRVAGLIPDGLSVADIGTDHALLPAYLALRGRNRRVVATDANASPLAVAGRTLERWGLCQAVELRLGDGLHVLRPGEADVLVLAGMGGDTITGILGARPEVAAAARLLVLQPMRSAHHLRRWLGDRGYAPLDEDIVRDGRRLFELLVAVPPGGGVRPVWVPPDLPAQLRYIAGPLLWAGRHPLLPALLGRRPEVALCGLSGM